MKRIVEKKNIAQSISLLQPTRPFFCTSKNADGTDHTAPFAWLMPISAQPPKVAFALQNERGRKCSQTLLNVLSTGEFVVNMPRMGQEHVLVQSSFGLVNHETKFDRTGFSRGAAQCVKPVVIEECSAHLECKVYQVLESDGDHTLLLADVVSAAYEEDCYDEELCPVIPVLRPLINLRDYRFDDHQRHVFIDTSTAYTVDAYYEKEEG